MADFPRTTVGGVSVSRMLIGTNWFLGYSHQSAAKDRFIKSYQTRQNVAEILTVFFESGIDTVMGMPVMTIKPMAAGRLIPPVGLAFVWNTLRDQDMVTVGTTTPDEAREDIELSFDFLERRMPDNELQATRSKKTLV